MNFVTFDELEDGRVAMTRENFELLRDAAQGKPADVHVPSEGRIQYQSLRLPSPRYVTEPDGVWFIYGHDQNTYPVGVHATEIEALRDVVDNNLYAKVVFWEFGKNWSQVERS